MSRVIQRHGEKDQVQFFYLLCLLQRVSLCLIDLHYSGLGLWFCTFSPLQCVNKSSQDSCQLPVLRQLRESEGGSNNARASLTSEKIKDIYRKHRIAFIFDSNYISFVRIPTTFLLLFIQGTFKILS